MALSPKIRIRGIRQPIPSGYVLGRRSAGTGQPELVSIGDLGQQLSAGAAISGAGGGSAILAPITDKNILANISGGTTQPVGHTLTAILDDIIGSTPSRFPFRNSTTWVDGNLTQPAAGLVVTAGTAGYALALANDLAALEGLSGTGLAQRTGADTWTLVPAALDTDTYLYPALNSSAVTVAGANVYFSSASIAVVANDAYEFRLVCHGYSGSADVGVYIFSGNTATDKGYACVAQDDGNLVVSKYDGSTYSVLRASGSNQFGGNYDVAVISGTIVFGATYNYVHFTSAGMTPTEDGVVVFAGGPMYIGVKNAAFANIGKLLLKKIS